MPDLEIRDLTAEELVAAGGVAGRALASSPSMRWTMGEPALSRIGSSLDVFVPYVEAMPTPQVGALLGRHVVGVCASAPPDTCVGVVAPPEWREPPAEIGEPGHESRAHTVWSLFATHDLDERHWHLGPVAVEPELQGAGIGSAMLRVVTERMDAQGEVMWLETDKPENVVLYRRHGFEVVEEMVCAPHVDGGFTNWFMRRDPRSPS